MYTTRRTVLGAGMLSLAALHGSSVQSSGPPPPYRIIYNWDGAPHDYSEFPQTLDQFLNKAYAPMKDTQVEAHFWCIGEHEAKWRSSRLEICLLYTSDAA